MNEEHKTIKETEYVQQNWTYIERETENDFRKSEPPFSAFFFPVNDELVIDRLFLEEPPWPAILSPSPKHCNKAEASFRIIFLLFKNSMKLKNSIE